MPCRPLRFPLLVLVAALACATPASAAPDVEGDFNGDGYADLAVGAPADSVGGQDLAGAVNVIYGSSRGLTAANDQQFTQDTTGVADVAEAGDRFGEALAVGDFDRDGFSDLVVGVPQEDVPTGLGPGETDRRDAGIVHVLYGSRGGLRPSGTAWSQDRPGINGVTEPGDRFGAAVAGGDFDGDGFTDMAVGVPLDSVGGDRDAGAVNVIYGGRGGLSEDPDELWTQDTAGIKGVAEPADRFGFAVAAADVSENNRAELIVGVPGDNVDGAGRAGAVNVIYGSSAGLRGDPDQLWTQDTRGINGLAEGDDQFGRAVTVGDFNADGAGDLAAGVPFENVGDVEDAGAVNVIYGSERGLQEDPDEIWTQSSAGIKGFVSRGDRFGMALGAGDFSRNNADDLAIGVPGERVEGQQDAGNVNVLYGTRVLGLEENADQLWNQGTPGIDGEVEVEDALGEAVATGDFDGDGAFDLAMGVPNESVAGRPSAGAVNVIYGSRVGLTEDPDRLWTQGTSGIEGAVGGDNFGGALASGAPSE